jgi:hypothetical protein
MRKVISAPSEGHVTSIEPPSVAETLRVIN